MNDEADRTIRSYNNLAANYAERQTSLKPVQRQLDSFLSKLKGDLVLDVGCGHGRESKYLSEKGKQVIGIDLSEGLLEIARQNASLVDFQQVDMRKLDFPDREFYGIWANTSFLHVPKIDASKTLSGFRRVIKLEGMLFLGIQGHRNEQGNIVEDLSEGEKMVSTPEFEGNPRFFAYYSLEEITDLLSKAGFKVVEVMTKEEPNTGIIWLDIFSEAV